MSLNLVEKTKYGKQIIAENCAKPVCETSRVVKNHEHDNVLATKSCIKESILSPPKNWDSDFCVDNESDVNIVPCSIDDKTSESIHDSTFADPEVIYSTNDPTIKELMEKKDKKKKKLRREGNSPLKGATISRDFMNLCLIFCHEYSLL